MGNNQNPKCACVNCANIGKYAHPVRRRGGGNAYLCEFHETALESYFNKNNYRLGERKANGDTFAVELETSYSNRQARIELCIARFLPTSDCTAHGGEFKSPIYEGACGLKAFLPSIEDMKRSGDIEINDSCGTHLHIGHHEYINPLYMSYIRRFYHSIFVPLSNSMEINRYKTEAIFGRYFGNWARAINTRIDAEEHTNFINTQHAYTLEYRICFFKDAAQYSKAIDLCREFNHIVIKTFCKKVERMGLHEGERLTDAQKTELANAARKTAVKLVNAFENA